MSDHLRLAWRQRITAATLPEDRYGTKARVVGHPTANCVAVYNRDTDTIIFVPKVPSKYDPDTLQPENLVPEGGIGYYAPPGWKFSPVGMGNGAALDITNGEIAPGSSAGVAPTSPTMFNPLYIEALERLLDTFPEMGRWPLYDAPAGYGGGHVRGTARDWLVNVNDMRGVFAEGRKLGFTQVCLYHGTMGMYADKIMQTGLAPRDVTGAGNHWLSGDGEDPNRWQSHEGLVYLSHPSRMTISRQAMSKAAEAMAEKLYGSEQRALEAEYQTLTREWYGKAPLDPERQAAYEAYWEKKRRLDERIHSDPRLEPVLLRVCIPREGWKNLRADEDTQEYADAATQMTNMPEWMGSIGSDAVVAYAGTIPAAWITVAARGQEALQAGMVGGPVFR